MTAIHVQLFFFNLFLYQNS